MQENITSAFRYLKGHYTEDRAEWFKVVSENRRGKPVGFNIKEIDFGWTSGKNNNSKSYSIVEQLMHNSPSLEMFEQTE